MTAQPAGIIGHSRSLGENGPIAPESVQGPPIDAWCDERRLSIEARIALFCQVCDAVQHAHLQGVMPGNVTPGNIIVTDTGHPMVGRSELGVPRSNSGKVSVADDVAALGALLHVMLSGRVPAHGKALSETALSPETDTNDVARADEIATLRGTTAMELHRSLRGDLDAIVATALHPDLHRRYASASLLASDLRRYLCGEAALARAENMRMLRALLRQRMIGRVFTPVGVAMRFISAYGARLLPLLKVRRAGAPHVSGW